MAGLPEVIGLLYRADWTRLSLSAELRFETDREPLPRLPRERWYRAWPGQRQDNGRYAGRGTLLIGPGGRWRLECPAPGRGAEGEAAEGNDGERGWSWRPPEAGGPPPLPVGLGAAYPPPPELFCPSCLLGGYTLEELGPVTAAGRGATCSAPFPAAGLTTASLTTVSRSRWTRSSASCSAGSRRPRVSWSPSPS
jgi:hypothetical protein